MKSKEISGVVEGVSNEKGLPKEKVFEAIENAIAFAAEKKYETENGIEISVRAEIDRRTCEYKTYRRWEVVEDDGPLAHPTMQVTLEAARLENPDIKPGEYIEDEVEIKSDDRITVQATRQFLQQKIREAERMEVIEKYRPMVGHIVSGIVKRKNHDRLIVEIGRGMPRPGMPRSYGTEAVLPASQLLPREAALFRVGDHISGLLLDIREDAMNGKGSGLTLSRTDPKFLTEVMRKEVPEIGEDLVEIKAVARMTQARRSKVALFAKDKRIDPIGACVGMKQSRITAIKDELGGEKVDLVKWDDDPVQYVMNAMQPAVVLSVRVDEVKHSMDLAVEEDNLSRAIGTGGQNINLASRLTGWHLNVLSKADFDKQESSEEEKLKKLLTENLNIDDEFAEVLIESSSTRALTRSRTLPTLLSRTSPQSRASPRTWHASSSSPLTTRSQGLRRRGRSRFPMTSASSSAARPPRSSRPSASPTSRPSATRPPMISRTSRAWTRIPQATSS